VLYGPNSRCLGSDENEANAPVDFDPSTSLTTIGKPLDQTEFEGISVVPSLSPGILWLEQIQQNVKFGKKYQHIGDFIAASTDFRASSRDVLLDFYSITPSLPEIVK
jgi:hypothetical protein